MEISARKWTYVYKTYASFRDRNIIYPSWSARYSIGPSKCECAVNSSGLLLRLPQGRISQSTFCRKWGWRCITAPIENIFKNKFIFLSNKRIYEGRIWLQGCLDLEAWMCMVSISPCFSQLFAFSSSFPPHLSHQYLPEWWLLSCHTQAFST